MKITDISVMRLNAPRRELKTKPRRQPWAVDAEVANPMSRYPKVKRHRSLWQPKWGGAWCKVTAEDLADADAEVSAEDSPVVLEANAYVQIADIGSLINWVYRAIQENVQNVRHL